MIVKDWVEEMLHDDEAFSKEGNSPKKRPQIQGIRGFYDTEQKEIESPFRKKKGGLSKLTLTNLAEAQPRKQAALEDELGTVLTKLQQKRDEFGALQKQSKSAIAATYSRDQLAELPKRWAESLEFQTPPDGVDYAEFSQDNKQHFNEI